MRWRRGDNPAVVTVDRPLFIGETANDCSPDPTHDGANRSADNGTAYGTGGSASRGPSGLSVGGKRKCKESKGGESREVANCHWSTFPRSLKLALGRPPHVAHGEGKQPGPCARRCASSQAVAGEVANRET